MTQQSHRARDDCVPHGQPGQCQRPTDGHTRPLRRQVLQVDFTNSRVRYAGRGDDFMGQIDWRGTVATNDIGVIKRSLVPCQSEA